LKRHPGWSNGVLSSELDLDHVELLEVRVRVPPAAPSIEPDSIGQDLAKRALGLLQVEAPKRRLEQPLATSRRIRTVEPRRSLLGESELVASEALRACLLKRTEKARTDRADEDEVIEKTGLQCGVLAVVRKTRNVRLERSSPESTPCIRKARSLRAR
jgi:hypothetical protein